MDKFHIVIVGHIDHGKSTLIGRLLHDTRSLAEGRLEEIRATCAGLGREFEFAYITDALLEERQDCMTIDTTQVVFKTARREYIIIDTPGHKELLKNMVTGASYAEGAILIVSAKDGIQEQTRRHAHILGLFGIKHIIALINKMDEVSYSQKVFVSLKGKLEELFVQFGMQAPYAIPISAKYGDNVVALSPHTPWYKGETLLDSLDSLQRADVTYDFRMAVQDVYPLNGDDLVIGRISSGKIQRGDRVAILPARKEGSVSSIRVFEGEKREAQAGESVGLVLEASPAPKRGDILSAGSLPPSGIEFKALVLCLKDQLLLRAPYLLQCATEQVSCKITEIEEHMDIATLQDIRGDFLNKAEISRISLVTDTPLVYEEFNKLHELGRFVLRKGSDIVGAGVIL